jgi:hypothetical protein
MAPLLSAVKARHDLHKQDEAPAATGGAPQDPADVSPGIQSNAPLGLPARGRPTKPSANLDSHGKSHVSTAHSRTAVPYAGLIHVPYYIGVPHLHPIPTGPSRHPGDLERTLRLTSLPAPGSDGFTPPAPPSLGKRTSPRTSPRPARINTSSALPEEEGQNPTDRDGQLTGSSTTAIDPLSQVSASVC